MKIVSVPAPVLSNKAKPVSSIDKKIVALIGDMEVTLKNQKDPEGVGLAAPQVGFPLALFIIRPQKRGKIQAFINPKILHRIGNQKSGIRKKSDDEAKLEGCLSIPKVWGQVGRDETIDVKYQTLEGTWKEQRFTGFEAVIIQHEIDHLYGILFTQRVLEQKGKLYKEIDGELKRYEI